MLPKVVLRRDLKCGPLSPPGTPGTALADSQNPISAQLPTLPNLSAYPWPNPCTMQPYFIGDIALTPQTLLLCGLAVDGAWTREKKEKYATGEDGTGTDVQLTWCSTGFEKLRQP